MQIGALGKLDQIMLVAMQISFPCKIKEICHVLLSHLIPAMFEGALSQLVLNGPHRKLPGVLQTWQRLDQYAIINVTHCQ